MGRDVGLGYLRTFPDFEQGNVAPETAFTLDRVLALLDEVGAPHLRLPVIHIAGTKGKGSTAAMIASITRAAGYRTGLFTQPHLLRVQERFQIDGESIDEDALDRIMLDRIRPAVERLRARGVANVQQFEAQVTLRRPVVRGASGRGCGVGDRPRRTAGRHQCRARADMRDSYPNRLRPIWRSWVTRWRRSREKAAHHQGRGTRSHGASGTGGGDGFRAGGSGSSGAPGAGRT